MALPDRLDIGVRLTLGFALLLTLLLAVAGFAATRTGVICEALTYYTVDTTPSLQSVRSWQSEAQKIRLLQAQHIMSESAAEMSELEAGIDKSAQTLTRELAAYEKLLSNEEDKRLWQGATAAARSVIAGWDALRTESRQTVGNPAEALGAAGLSRTARHIALNR